jgi:hypothetical protein
MSDRWPIERRFWLRVEKRSEGECWNWIGGQTVKGYGVIGTRGRERTTVHRVSWAIHNGRAIPDGMWVLHSCDNRLCVNPGHLRLGTNDDNVRDRVERKRTRTGRRKQCPNGHAKTPENTLVRKSGLHVCRICKQESSRRYYLRNKERVIKRTHGWRKRNRDKVNEYGRKYAAQDRERERARSRAYYAKQNLKRVP